MRFVAVDDGNKLPMDSFLAHLCSSHAVHDVQFGAWAQVALAPQLALHAQRCACVC